MSYQNKGVNILTQLGLTTRQAETYLAIIELEQPTVRAIAQTLQIARAEAYRITTELQKRGLIKKIITTPTAFRAAPLSEGFSILIERNAEKDKEIRNEAKQFLRNYKNNNTKKPSQENAQYCLTSGFKPADRNYSKELSETQTSKDCILEWRGFLSVVDSHFEGVKGAIQRGVKFRYITYVPEDTKIPQIIQTLTETGSFEVKSALTIPKAHIDIFDKKIGHIMIKPNDDLKRVEVLRLQNPALAELMQDYFELKWQSATTPRWHK